MIHVLAPYWLTGKLDRKFRLTSPVREGKIDRGVSGGRKWTERHKKRFIRCVRIVKRLLMYFYGAPNVDFIFENYLFKTDKNRQ